MGSSKALGINNSRKGSIHAEELAIKYCLKYDKKNKYKIYVWKWGNQGNIKTKFCCNRCCSLIEKYNFYNKIFTFKDNEKTGINSGIKITIFQIRRLIII